MWLAVQLWDVLFYLNVCPQFAMKVCWQRRRLIIAQLDSPSISAKGYQPVFAVDVRVLNVRCGPALKLRLGDDSPPAATPALGHGVIEPLVHVRIPHTAIETRIRLYYQRFTHSASHERLINGCYQLTILDDEERKSSRSAFLVPTSSATRLH